MVALAGKPKKQTQIHMAKRNKTKFASKSRKSALRVEALEQRRLLAAVSGAGTEVGSDIHHPNGNVYDQVLMTGSSVTIQNDVMKDPNNGDITRVSFLDLSGDIVQAEFSGHGTLTITLDDYSGPATPDNYNQDVQYVKGLASFTISGSDETTNFNVFTVGSATAVNQALFDDTHTGGDHWADVQRLTIVANPAQPNGSTFGSIFAGNAHFGGDSGVVGIAAANVHVQGIVRIGNIDAENSAVPTLVFGAASQFGSVYVNGGDLLSGNGNAINNVGGSGLQNPYVYDINFVAGAGSDGTVVAASHLKPGVTFQGPIGFVSTLDSSTSIDITGHSQSWLDDTFAGRTFTQDLTITGNLASGLTISAAAFRGNVEFTGDIAGNIILTDANASALPIAAFGGDVTFDGDVSGTIGAEGFGGAVTIDGDFSGSLWADVIASTGTAVLGSVGDVSVMGDFSGSIWSDVGIGDIYVGGDLTNLGGWSFYTAGTGGKYAGDIGNITVMGDVDQVGGFLDIAGGGTFGNVTVNGGGTLVNNVIGQFVVNQLTGNETHTGTITIADDTSLVFKGDWINSGSGTVGAVTITGADNNYFDLSGTISGGSVDQVTISGFHNIYIYSSITAVATHGEVAGVTITGSASTEDTSSSIRVYGGGDISGDTVGAITIGFDDADVGNSYVRLDGASWTATKSIGDVTVSGGRVDVLNMGIVAENFSNHVTSLGNVSITATYGDLYIDNSFIGAAFYNGDTFKGGAVGDISLSAYGDLTVTSEVEIAGATINSVSLDAGNDLTAALDIWATDTIGAVSVVSGGDMYIQNDFNVSEGYFDYLESNLTLSVDSVTFTAGGNLWNQGSVRADTVGDLTMTSTGGYVEGDFWVYTDTSLGAVSISADDYVDMWGSFTSAGSIDSISMTSTYSSVTQDAYIGADTIGAVTLSAYYDVNINNNIYAATSIASVTATSSYGDVNLNDDIYSAGSIGSVSFTAYNDVTIDNNDGIWAADLGPVTFDAGDDIWMDNYSFIHGDTLGDVTFTAGDHVGIYYGAWISADTAHDISITGSTVYLGGHGDYADYYDYSASGINVGTVNDITITADFTYLSYSSHIYADTAGVITVDGDVFAFAYDGYGDNIKVGTADLIQFTGGDAAFEAYDGDHNIVVTDSIGGIHFAGDSTYFEGYGIIDAKHATIDGSGSAGGVALEFTNLVVYNDVSGSEASEGVIQTHIVSGSTVFNGNTDLAYDGSDAIFWVADDHTAAHDTIGNITFNGTVSGVDGGLDIVASKIGNITIQAALDTTDSVLVTNLNVFAGNHTAWDYYGYYENAAYQTGETLARDGSNLTDYTIGAITVQDTGTDHFAGTSLFAGGGAASSFDAVGGVGAVSLLGRSASLGSSVLQSSLFADAAGSLRITAGVFGSADNALNAVYAGGFDFDGIGDTIHGVAGIGTVVDTTDYNDNSDFTELVPLAGAPWTLAQARELDSDFLSGSEAAVHIGNITITAASVTPAGLVNIDTVHNATGLHVMAAVDGNDETASTLDSDLAGAFGTIFIKSDYGNVLSMQDGDGQVYTAGDLNADPTAFNSPGYFIGTSFGKIQATNLSLASGDQLIIGNDSTATDTEADPDEFVVIVV